MPHTFSPFFKRHYIAHSALANEERPLGLFDILRRRKNAASDEDVAKHHAESLDYFEARDAIRCPECAKAQKHVLLVETEGEELECPECHYLHEVRRM